ncbi:MAG TPA: hypothetical protein VE597_04905 [Geminicoccaceae bacterium]|nr:hypothetical protein [Geminicoccaceae bacterium]
METIVAHALQILRNGILLHAASQIVDAALGWGLATATRQREDSHHRAGPLDVVTIRDIGVRREHQDYSCPVDVSGSAAQRLHRVAEAARWGLPAKRG